LDSPLSFGSFRQAPRSRLPATSREAQKITSSWALVAQTIPAALRASRTTQIWISTAAG
jgi:hypothetical protein